MNEPKNSEGPTPQETLNGGGEFPLRTRDGTERLYFIRQLSLGEMDALLAAQGDEIKLALLYAGTGRDQPADAAWLETLVPESQELLVAEGDRINADFFGRWFRRRLARQERLVPGSTARIMEAFNPETGSSNLPPARVVPAG